MSDLKPIKHRRRRRRHRFCSFFFIVLNLTPAYDGKCMPCAIVFVRAITPIFEYGCVLFDDVNRIGQAHSNRDAHKKCKSPIPVSVTFLLLLFLFSSLFERNIPFFFID